MTSLTTLSETRTGWATWTQSGGGSIFPATWTSLWTGTGSPTPAKDDVQKPAGTQGAAATPAKAPAAPLQDKAKGPFPESKDPAMTDPTHLSELEQLRQVDRSGIEAFGGVEFEHAVGPQHIKRADLRRHVLGDQLDDLIETHLRLQGLDHELPDAAHQHPRS